MLLEVIGNNLFVREKNFIVKISREIEMSEEDFSKLSDKYGTNSYCPPGEFYIFYRLRKDGDRLELCQKKPKELFTWNHKQGVLYSPKGTKRTNIQIHLGTKSKGCILIKDKSKFFKLLQIVADALNKGEEVKIKVDDYLKQSIFFKNSSSSI